MAAALITVNAAKAPPVLLIDETRDLAYKTALDTGLAADYARCKALLLNLAAYMATAHPFGPEDEAYAGKMVANLVADQALLEAVSKYRELVRDRFGQTQLQAVLRTTKSGKAQIYRKGPQFKAVVTFSFIRVEDHVPVMNLVFEVDLQRTEPSPAAAFGFVVTRLHPLDENHQKEP